MPTGIYKRKQGIKYGMSEKHHRKSTKEKLRNSQLESWTRDKREKQRKRMIRLHSEGKAPGFEKDHPFYGDLTKPNYFKKGNRPWNWQGGISFEPYPLYWTESLREFIRNKDNYICQKCGKTQEENGRKLDVHHIDYNKENCNLNNLVALCISCNAKVNYNKNYWIKFFKKLNEKKYFTRTKVRNSKKGRKQGFGIQKNSEHKLFIYRQGVKENQGRQAI